MVPDFLQAWLVEGDAVAAMGYVSERSLRVSGAGCARSVCLRPRPGAVSDPGQPESCPRGPRQARLARGPDGRRAFDDPGLRAVPQPHQAQFVSTTCPTTSRPDSTARAG